MPPHEFVDEALAGRDTVRTPWGWLRGFAAFLLLWPVLSLLAFDYFEDFDWTTLLIGIFGPPTVGLVLLGVERFLTAAFGAEVRASPRPVPSIWRDAGNLAFLFAVLMLIDIVLITIFEREHPFARTDRDMLGNCTRLLALFCGTALGSRLLARWLDGPRRLTDLGPGWDATPTMIRFGGYLALIPLLLVDTVMIDEAMSGKPVDFGLRAWIVLPLLTWLGLRSAMARSPRYWARNPWEALLRRRSLALPWILGCAGAALALGIVFVLLGLGVVGEDEDIGFWGNLCATIITVPIGLLLIAGAVLPLASEAREWIHGTRALLRLRRDPGLVASWSVATSAATDRATDTVVQLRLRDDSTCAFVLPEGFEEVPAWLSEQAPHPPEA
ncbi:MAG: hypothetical protein ACYTGX_02965 [Planctomycetota bacterium]|jgi:hypothetical protein